MSYLACFRERPQTVVHTSRGTCGRSRTLLVLTWLAVVVVCSTPLPVTAEPEPGAETSADDADAPTPRVSTSPPPGGADAAIDIESGASAVGAPQAVSSTAREDPTGMPPDVVAADPRWHDRSESGTAVNEPTEPNELSVDVALGLQWFLVSGKAMPGVVLRFGDELYWGALEFSPIWLTKASESFDVSFLGNQWGFYFELAPLRTERVEVLGGVGLDIYHLWGIHGDEAMYALAFKASGLFRVWRNTFGLATLRGYPLRSQGLGLGEMRDARQTVPLMGTLGVEWRFE